MPKPGRRPRSTVREPVQVYLEADDSALLARLAAETGLSKAEILRQGMRSFARAQSGTSPMLRFLDEAGASNAPAGAAADHDAVLAESYRGVAKKKRR
jgi:hypothetical protein